MEFIKTAELLASALIGGELPLMPAADYYSGIDASATDLELKQQLKDLISNHTVLSYDDVWTAFESVDKFLPGYPCDSSDPTKIPDIYSGYCWKSEKNN